MTASPATFAGRKYCGHTRHGLPTTFLQRQRNAPARCLFFCNFSLGMQRKVEHKNSKLRTNSIEATTFDYLPTTADLAKNISRRNCTIRNVIEAKFIPHCEFSITNCHVKACNRFDCRNYRGLFFPARLRRLIHKIIFGRAACRAGFGFRRSSRLRQQKFQRHNFYFGILHQCAVRGVAGFRRRPARHRFILRRVAGLRLSDF